MSSEGLRITMTAAHRAGETSTEARPLMLPDAATVGELLLKALAEGRVIISGAVPAPHMLAGDGLLTKQQVADRIGGKCSIRKVERLMKAGKLKKVPNLGVRTVRFRPCDVERMIADQENRPGRRRL